MKKVLFCALGLAVLGCGGYVQPNVLAVVTLTGASLSDGRLVAMENDGFYISPGQGCEDDNLQSWCLGNSDGSKKEITFYTQKDLTPFRIYIENKSGSDEIFHLKVVLDGSQVYDKDIATTADEKHEVGSLWGTGFFEATPMAKKK